MLLAKSIFCAAMLLALAIFASAILLATLQWIYNVLFKREEDATTFAAQLCTLITIACFLFAFCDFYGKRFNDSAKSVLGDIGGAQLAMYTINVSQSTIFQHTILPVAKSVLSLTLLCVLGIFASAILLATAMRALPFVRRRPTCRPTVAMDQRAKLLVSLPSIASIKSCIPLG
jgi:hypothetical protein